MAIQVGLNKEILKKLTNNELYRLLKSVGDQDLQKVITEIRRRKGAIYNVS